jgi:hypothetical protein
MRNMSNFWYVYVSIDFFWKNLIPKQNELVKSRLRNEEMEEELVRYKLL